MISFETYIPVIDKDVLTGWGKMSNGETLTDDEQMKVSRLSDILEEFLSADKYVFCNAYVEPFFPTCELKHILMLFQLQVKLLNILLKDLKVC